MIVYCWWYCMWVINGPSTLIGQILIYAALRWEWKLMFICVVCCVCVCSTTPTCIPTWCPRPSETWWMSISTVKTSPWISWCHISHANRPSRSVSSQWETAKSITVHFSIRPPFCGEISCEFVQELCCFLVCNELEMGQIKREWLYNSCNSIYVSWWCIPPRVQQFIITFFIYIFLLLCFM